MIVFVNLLTASRIFGIVPFMWLVRNGYIFTAFLLFVLLALTDALDGYLARKYRCVTDWGRFFDPVADKVLFLTAIFVLLPPDTVGGRFSVGGTFFALVAVEFGLFCMAAARYMFGMIGFALGANWFGKTKVWIEIGVILTLFASASAGPSAVQQLAVYNTIVFGWLVAAFFAALGSFIGHVVAAYHRDVKERLGRL